MKNKKKYDLSPDECDHFAKLCPDCGTEFWGESIVMTPGQKITLRKAWKRAGLLLIVTSLLILTSCVEDNGNTSSPPEKYSTKTENNRYYNPEHVAFVEVDTPNGRVDCIWAVGHKEGSLSCNWEKFNKAK